MSDKNKNQIDKFNNLNDELDINNDPSDQNDLELEEGKEKDILPLDKKTEEEEEEEEDNEDNEENDREEVNDNVVVGKSKIILIKRLLENIKENNDKLIAMLSILVTDEEEPRISISQIGDNKIDFNDIAEPDLTTQVGKVIEGVFDGENMVGPDGKQYSVPANYASKSKLVEGDILKLIITDRGTFVYKQIGPIERIRVVGKLEKNNDGNFIVIADGKQWRVLSASVTYFKGKLNDEVVILIPKTGESKWAAVENIIRDDK